MIHHFFDPLGGIGTIFEDLHGRESLPFVWKD